MAGSVINLHQPLFLNPADEIQRYPSDSTLQPAPSGRAAYKRRKVKHFIAGISSGNEVPSLFYPDPVPIRICLEGKHTDQSKERSLKDSLCIEVDEAFPIVIIDRTVSAVLDFQRIDIRMQDRFHFPCCHTR